jgi:Ser/Thr protein kinase RdoA (MazF antagonist)
VLRYKPERRLVLLLQNGGAPVVVTASAKPPGTKHQHFHDTLHLNGVPVLPQLGDSECAERGLSACAAWGGGDLAGLDDAHGAWRAGGALARVHDIPPPGDSSVERPALHHDLAEQLAATRSMVASLVPALENSARKLEDVLRTLLTARGSLAARGSGEPALVHGDFAPEQVLVRGSEVRIIDFNNACIGAPEADLGSFAAAEEASRPLPASGSAGGPLTERLAEGYAEAGGRFRQTGVDAWTAFRLFTSCVEPFNDRAPEWAEDMSWHLRRAQDLTAS